ncbi:MAG: CinA family protein [Sulfurospirillaceae bacterium]|nr:CinA family protein [Sulfurospirillaceae bacterium]
MKNALIVVGKTLKHNTPFLNYIYSVVSLHVGIMDQTIFLDKSDKDMFFTLEETLNNCEQALIFASEDNFNLIGKTISTLNKDALELKEDTLMPSQASIYEKNSYVISNEKYTINVIKAIENKTLPPILLQKKGESFIFSMIGLDQDSTKILLEPLAQNYEIKINVTSIIEGWASVEAVSCKYGNMENFLKSVKSLFPTKFIQSDNIVKHIVESLNFYAKTLTVAESCTGGLICSMLTRTSGASNVFSGGLVTYANEIKESWLGVSKETIERHGAVSELCVKEMLEGSLNTGKADFAIATSGIAGPDGGTAEKPIGTVFIGVQAKNSQAVVERLLLQGDRHYIQSQSAYHALKLLLQVGEKIFFVS